MNVSEGIALIQTTVGLLVYADVIAFLGYNIDMMKRLGKKLIL